MAVRSRYLAVAGLIAVLLLAGCLGPESDQQGEQKASEEGVVISDLVISRTDIKRGEKTRVNVLFQNRNKVGVEGLEATLLNTGPLNVVGERKCDLGRLRGTERPSTGSRKQCIWILECGDNCQSISKQSNEKFSVEPYIKFTYLTQVSDDSKAVEVEFQRSSEFDSSRRSQKTYSISNGDIGISVNYDSPLPADTRSMNLDYTLTNEGGGELLSPIEMTYKGSFVKNDKIRKSSLQECSLMGIPSDETLQDVECSMELNRPTPGTVYTLRLRGTYEYRKEKSISLKILPSESDKPLPGGRKFVGPEEVPKKREDCFNFCYRRQEESLGLSACLDVCK